MKYFMDVTFKVVSDMDKRCRIFTFDDEISAIGQVEEYLWDKKVEKVILYKQYKETSGEIVNIPMIELIKT